MNYSLEIITAPSYLPASVADVKKALNIDNSSQDEVITKALNSAIKEAEKRSGHTMAEREIRVSFSKIEQILELPVHPVFEVVSVEYWNGSTWTAFTDYEADLNAEPAVVWFKSFPAVSEKLKPYRITLKTGYEAAANPNEADTIPDDLKLAVIFYACQHVIYRGEISERAMKAFRMMLSPYKVLKL